MINLAFELRFPHILILHLSVKLPSYHPLRLSFELDHLVFLSFIHRLAVNIAAHSFSNKRLTSFINFGERERNPFNLNWQKSAEGKCPPSVGHLNNGGTGHGPLRLNVPPLPWDMGKALPEVGVDRRL